ncbi:MAG: alpha/beta fold hydrolase [bacterium]
MRAILSFVLIAGSVYVGICVLLFVFQEKLLFFPDRTISVTPQSGGLGYEPVTMFTEDNVKISGWHIPAEEAKFVLLFFHGNAGNISDRLESLQIFHGLGLSVLIVDYRGYGESGGRPSESGTYRDAEAAWSYLVDELGFSPEGIIVFGRSLGAGVATWLAAKHRPAALILESAFASAPELGSDLYWFLPIRLLSRIKYDNLARMQQITCPLLVIHSPDDEIIPYKHGRKLFEAASAPKEFLQLQYGHNEGFLLSGSRYVNGIRNFIDNHVP